MDIELLAKSAAIGLSIAAPVGPIGVLCIRRTVAYGRACGLVTGLGAATADAVYACLAGFGITFVSRFLVDQRVWLGLAGGLFLGCLGVKILLARPAETAVETGKTSLAGAYASTLLLTLANPMTILSFAALFSSAGRTAAAGSYGAAAVFVAGVFMGSALWWVLLSGGLSLFRGRVTPRGLLWINRISGAIITGYGVSALLGLLEW